MATRILNIVSVAYRATLEEQDDPVLWITQTLKGNGADAGVLLRGAAVNYLVKGQDASGLAFGDKAQTHPPDLAGDVSKLVAKGVPVHYVAEDARERGLPPAAFVDGVQPIARAELPALYDAYSHVWTW